MSKLQFPKNFWWGGAVSTMQVDGTGFTKQGQTSFEYLFRKKPELFYNQVGPTNTVEFLKNYQTDLAMMHKIGFNSLRIGFAWTRLFPDGKNLDQEAVKFYHNLLDEAKRLNIELVIQLYHYDMPQWATEKGEWESWEVIDAFVKYCDFVFKEYGAKVRYFATINEPFITIQGSYIKKSFPPLISDGAKAIKQAYGLILAHARVVNLFNKKYKAKLSSKIGLIVAFIYSYPKDNINFSKEDKKATDNWNLLFYHALHDPMILGTFPQGTKKLLTELNVLPNYNDEGLAEISQVKLDFLGLNYYTPRRKKASENGIDFEDKIAEPFMLEKARMNLFRGWEIHPQSLYLGMMMFKNRYHNIPFYIAENGMGVQKEWNYRDAKTGEIADDYRIAFVKEHLEIIHKAINDGANCFGYHIWSAIDCWSFLNGFRNTYGLIEVDLKNNLKRRYKKSAHFYHDLIQDNGFDGDYPKIEEFFDLVNVDFEKSTI